MTALVELVDLKCALTNERNAARRSEIMIKISSCEDSIMTLVRASGERDELYRKFECRELVRKFEREAKTRRVITKKLRAHEIALTPSAKRAASAPKIAARYGVIVSGRTIHTGRSKISALTRRYVRRFGPPTEVKAFIDRLRAKGLLKVRNAAGMLFELDDRTARRIVNDVFRAVKVATTL